MHSVYNMTGAAYRSVQTVRRNFATSYPNSSLKQAMAGLHSREFHSQTKHEI